MSLVLGRQRVKYKYPIYNFFPCDIQVRRTREAALDAQFLVLVSNLGSEQAQHLQTGITTFEPRTFAEKLVCNLLCNVMSS